MKKEDVMTNSPSAFKEAHQRKEQEMSKKKARKSTFDEVVAAEIAAQQKEVAAAKKKEEAERQAAQKERARLAKPLHGTAAALQTMMDDDSKFKQYMEERVLTGEWWPSEFRPIACTDYGTRTITHQYRSYDKDEDIPNTWALIARLSKGKVELRITECYLAADPDPQVPKMVYQRFQPVLDALKDRETAYTFLLKEFGQPKK
ncbi:hypothetical protein A3D71_02725 [Candidatus Kaiserbacteria bacterium RIFCSPHIGHO2_02_FULL_55_20]|uniref:Uncharacterized protein n=1 Tax=Candidatus Kaiserbacteria bacterium RIFCSPHIGHO2_02_FULL_55_20 TaxID=1798497 RepID=A0A1F6DYS4_9BACT|nr:MAG: hypothetical protein A2680_00065 [Candidatus Kaiserbacteria bacterium RIFCSPHIGHO2_01_FULL_55_37]OGG66548.1 MAG: hypothetical protein A3D71_02725 [Candidatus Kaiserbacteria bacterium RIFCSPHIGHO2_02_FULL_55_20]